VTRAPLYERPWLPTPPAAPVSSEEVPLPCRPGDVLLRLMGCPDLSSKRWIWEQYDSQVGADTLAGPGGDAAVVRIHGTGKALALTTDCTPRYCLADPFQGGAQAVAEAWRNLTAVGALPLAITDNLNFGNPEKPRIMGQLVGCIQGMAAACRALDFPVVSGNVSLYNETNGEAILPTPAIGGLGLLPDARRRVGLGFVQDGDIMILLGETRGHLGQSLYLREIHGREDGPPPPVTLADERRTGDLVRGLIHDGLVTACHDLADGGLAVAAAEMALAGDRGAELVLPIGVDPIGFLFGEDQARYLITAVDPLPVLHRAGALGVPACVLGTTGGTMLTINRCNAISLAQLRTVHERWLPQLMAGAASSPAEVGAVAASGDRRRP
jgi:phosphoribosylformylglycinamidine synthase